MKKVKDKKESRITAGTYFSVSLRSLKEWWELDKVNLLLRLFLQALIVVLSVVGVYVASRVLGQVIDSVQLKRATSSLYPLVGLQVAVYLASTFANSVDRLLDDLIFLKSERVLTLKLNSTRADLDTEFFEDRVNQKLLNKIAEKGVWSIYNLNTQLIYLFGNVIKFILVIGIALKVGVLAVVVLILAALPRLYADVRKSKVKWQMWELGGDEFHVYSKTINKFKDEKSLLEIRLYGLKQRLLNGIAGKKLEEFNRGQARASKSAMGFELGADLVYEFSFFAISLPLIQKTISGVYSVADFSFYLGALSQFNSAVVNTTSILTRINGHILYARDLYKLFEAKPVISSPPSAVKLAKDVTPTIEFRNVSFAYRSNPKEKILQNLNLTINPGEHLALVGENGAGKTTIIKLLLRLYDVTEGEILINGVNIKEIDLDSYWRQIGVLFQDFNRYPFDIQTNIEFGRVNKESSKKEMDRAVELANLDPILKKLPKGINTILDNSFEEGVEPSGGQWQRVALARAFYRNSNILILDEPTAAVDANAEYEIFNNIFAHYGDKTALIISHRFSTVKRAQRIVVLDKGRIIEEGSHRELMKSSKLYAEMFTKQAEGYKD